MTHYVGDDCPGGHRKEKDMTNEPPGYIYILDNHTGNIHRLDLAGRSREDCNLDQVRKAGHDVEIDKDDALAIVKEQPRQRCGRCWPVQKEAAID